MVHDEMAALALGSEFDVGEMGVHVLELERLYLVKDFSIVDLAVVASVQVSEIYAWDNAGLVDYPDYRLMPSGLSP